MTSPNGMNRMKLNMNNLVLEIIAEEGGRIQGKTLLQMRAYFLGLLLGEEFGYQPHYFGPYSPAIESALGDLRGLRFVEESFRRSELAQYGFESKQFEYFLTEDGEKVVDRVKRRNTDDYQKIKNLLDRIKDAGNPDYFTLSVAAKTMQILEKIGKPLTRTEFINEARSLNWNIPNPVIESAIEFLENIGIAPPHPSKIKEI